MSPIRFLMLAGTLLWLPAAHATLFQNASIDLARETSQAAREGKQLAVLFEQEGCDACKRLKQTVLSDRQAERRFGQRYRTVSVDLASTGDIVAPNGKTVPIRAWAERLRILGTPALAFFDQGGQLLYRHVGPLNSSGEFLLLGQYIAKGEYETRPFVSYLAAQQAKRRGDKETDPAICHTPKTPDSK